MAEIVTEKSQRLLTFRMRIGEVVIEGMVSSTEEREIRNEKIIFMFNVTDFTDTISAKIFIKKDEADPIRDNIKKVNS